MAYDEYDEYRIKNQHCTADEIDERQAMELSTVLDKWEAGQIPPWEVLLQTSFAVGANCGFLFNYLYYRDCETAEGARARVIKDYRKYHGVYATTLKSEDPQSIADATWSERQKYQEALTGLKGKMRPEALDEKSQSVIHENIRAIRTRLENAEFDSWATAIAIAEVLLSSPPSSALQVEPYDRSVSYIDTKDGKVTPIKRYDLDDLWVLYYLMEPVIEPSPQIAAAMNSACYAEERGAILSPYLAAPIIVKYG